ncbi:MAG: hypothetical protein LC747_05210, partial [Acidobacteria bacterium]|nr:hypothetical protein [Acidobacteriota bacterium]
MTTPPRQGDANRLKILLVLVSVFLLGGVTGAMLDGVYRLRGDHERRQQRGEHGERKDKIF